MMLTVCNDGTNALYQVNSSTIETALTAGTNVILQARQDIFVQSDIIATGSSGGDLTLNAGVDIEYFSKYHNGQW